MGLDFTTGMTYTRDMTENEKELPEGPYKAYDLLTNEYLGGYDSTAAAYVFNPNRPITTVYRPSRRKKVK